MRRRTQCQATLQRLTEDSLGWEKRTSHPLGSQASQICICQPIHSLHQLAALRTPGFLQSVKPLEHLLCSCLSLGRLGPSDQISQALFGSARRAGELQKLGSVHRLASENWTPFQRGLKMKHTHTQFSLLSDWGRPFALAQLPDTTSQHSTSQDPPPFCPPGLHQASGWRLPG